MNNLYGIFVKIVCMCVGIDRESLVSTGGVSARDKGFWHTCRAHLGFQVTLSWRIFSISRNIHLISSAQLNFPTDDNFMRLCPMGLGDDDGRKNSDILL